MGLGGAFLRDLIELKRAGWLRGNSVAEIGAQQLADSFVTSPDLPELYSAFSRELIQLGDPVDIANFAEAAPSSREFWHSLGMVRSAFDYPGHPDSVPIDLNSESIASNLIGAFDLVVNTGTTEHIANQANVFRVIHDLTCHGGIMYHELPLFMPDHGLVNYNPKLFGILANQNDYEVIFQRVFSYPISDVPQNWRSQNIKFGASEALSIESFPILVIRVAYRKNFYQPFSTPLDVPQSIIDFPQSKMPLRGSRSVLRAIARRVIRWSNSSL